VKITWFGGETFRIQIGGQILVSGVRTVPNGVDRTELLSGVDLTINGDLNRVDPALWRPRSAERLIDAEGRVRPVEVWSAGPGVILIDADDDRPLMLVNGEVPAAGRWIARAVAILSGIDLAGRGKRMAELAPRLIALAGDDQEVDAAFAALGDRLDGTGLVALERGLAIEV
jgi:hypothetical protein